MREIPSYFHFLTQGKANPEAIICVPGVRFTLLTSRLIRIEYSLTDNFEDRPTQIFLYRNQTAPKFDFIEGENGIEIKTEFLTLRYKPSQPYAPFTKENLTIVVNKLGVVWEYGMEDRRNLGGTLRTLDTIDGSAPLEPGLVSRSGWSIIDDTRGLVFNDQCWLETRNAETSYEDFYFLGYGTDYQSCLQDYCEITGRTGLVPRWVLGNWWSRYWEYSDQELRNLLLDFRTHEIPLSVCIIDMDWHITETSNQSSGWTGYTWNRTLFPKPEETVQFIHDLGLRTGLNLHPALGIFPHEDQYTNMALAMGIDPESKEPVPFEPENPDFIVPYFEYLHHPQEDNIGIDFWWMDWQQGNPNKLPGLNLLWWINHIHYYDLGRDKSKRSFVFSRWGGLGNHRYPIGFSGDTVITWDSLAFQPYLTATAANVGFGWWSHDIGGHMGGITDGELYARWVQLGVFSPVLRLHSTKNPFLERRPWGYDHEAYLAAKEAMRLRHTLVPYLYSMAWRDHTEGIVLVRPMYFQYPELEQAYACPNQYLFGSELIAAPYIDPIDEEIGLSRQLVWLPQGTWFNFFNGTITQIEETEGKFFTLFGDLSEIPVFAKAGAIVPVAEIKELGGVDVPGEITIKVYPGANNTFILFEDDGNSAAYQEGVYATTRLSQEWKRDNDENALVFRLHKVDGDTRILPKQRLFNFEFNGIASCRSASILVNGTKTEVTHSLKALENRVLVQSLLVTPDDWVEVTLEGIQTVSKVGQTIDAKKKDLERLIRSFKLNNDVKRFMHERLDTILENPDYLMPSKMYLTTNQLKSLLEVMLESGMEYRSNTGKDEIVIWNNGKHPMCSWSYTFEQPSWENPYHMEQGSTPQFRYIDPKAELEHVLWGHETKFSGIVQIDYGPILKGVVVLNPKNLEKPGKVRWY